MERSEPAVQREVTVTVADSKGRKWKLTREGDGVKIEAPVRSAAPIGLADLRAALDALES